LHDLLGPEFSLICFDQALADQLIVSDLTVCLLQPASETAQILGASADSAYLVRPDGHIAGRWKSARQADILIALKAATVAPKEVTP